MDWAWGPAYVQVFSPNQTSTFVYIYIYICMYVCMYVCMYDLQVPLGYPPKRRLSGSFPSSAPYGNAAN